MLTSPEMTKNKRTDEFYARLIAATPQRDVPPHVTMILNHISTQRPDGKKQNPI